MPSTLTEKLEAQLRHLSLLLYDTRVPAEQVDREVRPFCDELIRFTDPWQRGTGLANYRLGVAGFHAMFKFDLEILQLNVALQDDGRTGR